MQFKLFSIPATGDVKDSLGLRRYVRYMDDFVVWGPRKDGLRDAARDIGCFLRDSLRLELKPVCLGPCSRGMTFLGYRIFPGRVRLAARSRRRFRRKLARYHFNYVTGLWSEEETARHVEPLLAFVRRAESRQFRQRAIESVSGPCPKEAPTA